MARFASEAMKSPQTRIHGGTATRPSTTERIEGTNEIRSVIAGQLRPGADIRCLGDRSGPGHRSHRVFFGPARSCRALPVSVRGTVVPERDRPLDTLA